MSTEERFPTDQKGSILSTFAAALSVLAVAQIIAGLVLSFPYSSDTGKAHAAVAEMHAGGMKWVQSFHYWSSSFLIAGGLLLLGAWIATGRFQREDRVRMLSTAVLLLSALTLQVTGNLLPFDRHGVQTAAIEGGIGGRVPIVGTFASHTMLGGTEVGPATLSRWAAVHEWVLPLVFLASALVLLRVARKDGARWSLPPALSVVVLLVSVFVASPLGSPALEADSALYGANPSWYTAPMHGALVMFEKISPGLGWIGALLMPTALGLLVVALLWKGDKISVGAARGALLGFVLIVLVLPLVFVSAVAPLTGTRDPGGQEIVARPAGDVQNAALAQEGRKAFNTLPCLGCHGQDGSGGKGGPSLKRVFERHPDANFYIQYIHNPRSVDSGSTMPAFATLSEAQRKALAEFLRFPH